MHALFQARIWAPGHSPCCHSNLVSFDKETVQTAAVKQVSATMTITQTHSELVSVASGTHLKLASVTSGADGHIFPSCSGQDKIDASINVKMNAGKMAFCA